MDVEHNISLRWDKKNAEIISSSDKALEWCYSQDNAFDMAYFFIKNPNVKLNGYMDEVGFMVGDVC